MRKKKIIFMNNFRPIDLFIRLKLFPNLKFSHIKYKWIHIFVYTLKVHSKIGEYLKYIRRKCDFVAQKIWQNWANLLFRKRINNGRGWRHGNRSRFKTNVCYQIETKIKWKGWNCKQEVVVNAKQKSTSMVCPDFTTLVSLSFTWYGNENGIPCKDK